MGNVQQVFLHTHLALRLRIAAISFITLCMFGCSGDNNPPDPEPPQPAILERAANSSCLAGDMPESASGLSLERAFAGAQFSLPVALKQPQGSDTWYVVQKAGEIYRFTEQNSTPELAIDLRSIVDDSANESGLLAIAFAPDFVVSQHWYAFYQTRENRSRKSVLARFTGMDISTREELIKFTPPFGNHFGGEIAFGPEGYLYLSIGDGGSGGDPGNRAQNTTNLFGTLLRLDVSPQAPEPYGIPASNIFSGNPLCATGSSQDDCPEIYAYGLRNSWRFSFDEATDNLWLADVGQDAYEEINLIVNGGNYGWRLKEGFQCYNPAEDCERPGLIDPVAQIVHPAGESITGGRVYRGQSITGLIGKYIFADYQTGVIWALESDEDGSLQPRVLIESGRNIGHFAEDKGGELYVLDYASGRIFKLVASEGSGIQAPAKLSETGCVTPEDPTQKSAGVVEYRVNAAFWSDGAIKQRFVALPEGEQLSLAADDSWEWPTGSVLIKDFYWEQKLIETRFMKLHSNDAWRGYSYAWNAEQTEAFLVAGGKTGAFNNDDWIYPSGPQCLQCHTQASGRVLGADPLQLNKILTASHRLINLDSQQLEAWAQWAFLPAGYSFEAALPNPNDSTLSLDARARAYLMTNCAQCHRSDGPTNIDMDLRYGTAMPAMEICNIPATDNFLNLDNASRLSPGNADLSMIYQRMIRRDQHAMPPIGSYQVDTEGAELIKRWIEAMTTSQCD